MSPDLGDRFAEFRLVEKAAGRAMEQKGVRVLRGEPVHCGLRRTGWLDRGAGRRSEEPLNRPPQHERLLQVPKHISSWVDWVTWRILAAEATRFSRFTLARSCRRKTAFSYPELARSILWTWRAARWPRKRKARARCWRKRTTSTKASWYWVSELLRALRVGEAGERVVLLLALNPALQWTLNPDPKVNIN